MTSTESKITDEMIAAEPLKFLIGNLIEAEARVVFWDSQPGEVCTSDIAKVAAMLSYQMDRLHAVLVPKVAN